MTRPPRTRRADPGITGAMHPERWPQRIAAYERTAEYAATIERTRAQLRAMGLDLAPDGRTVVTLRG